MSLATLSMPHLFRNSNFSATPLFVHLIWGKSTNYSPLPITLPMSKSRIDMCEESEMIVNGQWNSGNAMKIRRNWETKTWLLSVNIHCWPIRLRTFLDELSVSIEVMTITTKLLCLKEFKCRKAKLTFFMWEPIKEMLSKWWISSTRTLLGTLQMKVMTLIRCIRLLYIKFQRYII